MSVRRIVALLGAPLALAAACAALAWGRAVDVRTSLDDLIGTAGKIIPSAVRSRSSELVPVIVSSVDADLSRRAADAFHAALGRSQDNGRPVEGFCESVRYRFDGDGVKQVMDFARTHRAGLVSPETAERLKTPEGRAAIAKKALRRYYSSPVPPLFPAAEDPFCLLDGFVTSLPSSYAGWFPKNGVLTAERGGRCHVLLLLRLKRAVVADVGELVRFRQALDAAVAAVAGKDGVQVAACGVPLHTAVSAARCQREIGFLTWFSLVFIAVLSVVAFRSVRWIPLLALTLAVSVLAGLASLFAVFGGLHLMTIVMGTTVLGLVIDYAFHWLLHAADDRRETVRNLLVSFVTTEISLLPLVFSSVAVLWQSAVFLGVGLAAALGYVLCCYPCGAAPHAAAEPVRGFGGLRLPLLVIAAVSGYGLFSLRFGTDMTAVYRSPAELLAPERLFAELSGVEDGTRGFVVTEGGDLEDRLAREASLGLPPDVPRLSRFLPPLAVRQAVAADVRRLYAEQGEKMAQALGLSKLHAPTEPTAWRAEDLPDELRRNFLSGGALVIASAPPPEKSAAGVTFCRPRTLIGEVLSEWADETRLRLGLALALMFVVLLACYRGRAVAVFLPSAFALGVVGGVLGLCGVSVNLFHLLAGFLLAGMSVDYTVFLHSGKSLKPALCSLLTSLAGFGALVFVSFPVVKSFGAVLGLGLPVAFVAALATMPRGETVEKGASPLGLEILWIFYRLFGLRALHLAAACVGVCVWAFSGAVRRASPSARKVVLFTRSLADKLVVMAEGKDLPRVETDGSADAESFLADVRGGKGVFVLSSHCGTVEMLVALGECEATFHALTDVARTSVFNRFYLCHARRPRVVIHPIAEIGMETAFFAGEALDRGDCLVMAGDRGRGAFRFAHALGHPAYFVACVWTGDAYRAIVRRLPEATAEMERCYGDVLNGTVAAYPLQHFTWEK